ncbi:hypothetical protein ONZ51_g11352 [Trametes cubensis]|uniref:Uncharacterized protein n=1 Tax=Trametes cubensis TaxID=1111947 RepID=A0AAD7TIB4_9APHY|nr:hypothetical protein ONZ51_g11352 [Trametes cubensis]
MASSLLDHSRRPTRQPQPQPQLDSEPIQVAPYLTHVVAHHGQLTLIPPQNAGRIRKSKSKKKRQPSSRDRRLEDDEPRFTTAVPASSSRKLHPAPAHIRTRKHAISAPSPTTPTAPRRFDPVPDDQSIPDYPPPSFEDAIASPHVPPSLVHPQSVQNAHPHGSISPESPPSQQVQHLQQYPYSSHVASLSSATILSSAPSVNGPASISQPSSGHQPFVGPQHSTARLASMSTTTLLSPATTATESTALSEMSLLRPPRPRTMPQPSPLARSNSGPFRLASPSTTTLVVPVTAMRDSPAISQTSLSRPQETYRHPGPEPDIDEEPESPIVEPLTPLSPPASPHPHYRGSISTVSDVVEELTFEPYQRWSADRRLGLSLEQRVQREFERRNITEAREAFGMTSRPAGNVQESTSNLTASGSMPSTPPSSPSPHARRCSHCGSVRPRDCGDTQTIDEHSDEDDPATNTDEEDEDEDHFPTSQRGSPLPRGAGRSPYLHPGPGTSSNARSRARFHSHSPEPGSPASPMSPSMSFFKMPSAWASTVTLSLAHALGPHKGSPAPSSAPAASPASTSAQPGSVSPPGSGLKRKESFGVRRLFGSLKGKEREREQRSREYAALQASPQAASTSISATLDSSDSSTESVDGWEVVGGGESPGARSSNGSTSTAPTSPARSTTTTEASSPTSESARAAAFLNRPVRHRSPTSPLLDSPISPLSHSPAHGPSGSPPTVTASPAAPVVATTAAAAAAARPYLPEKSPLRLIASANHIRQTYPHAHLQADPFAPPTSAPSPLSGTPRALRPSPSVVWKPPVAGANATTASTGGNVHAGSPNSPVQRSPLSQGSYPPPSQHLCPHTAQAQQQPQPQPQLHAKQQRHYQPPPPPHQQKPQPPPSPVGPRASPIPLAATYPMPPRTTETPAALPHTVLQSHEATAHTPTPEATSMSAPHTPVQPMAPLRRRRELHSSPFAPQRHTCVRRRTGFADARDTYRCLR